MVDDSSQGACSVWASARIYRKPVPKILCSSLEVSPKMNKFPGKVKEFNGYKISVTKLNKLCICAHGRRRGRSNLTEAFSTWKGISCIKYEEYFTLLLDRGNWSHSWRLQPCCMRAKLSSNNSIAKSFRKFLLVVTSLLI